MAFLDDSDLTGKPSGIFKLSLSDQVKQYILDEIERGELKPGDRLVESQLAKHLKISQAPVREAIRELVSTGFLVRTNKSTNVRMLTDEDMLEIYTVRASLEALVAQLAVQNITDEDLQALRKIIGEMIEMVKANDYIAAARCDWQFHVLIVELSGNKLLRRLYENLQLSQYTLITMRRSSISLENLARRHLKVIDALETRDPEIAKNVMSQHIKELGPVVIHPKAA
jgi:DNA-binding GntR family transcriptional regulator